MASQYGIGSFTPNPALTAPPATSAGAPGGSGFNINPGPQGGVGPYGGVPGPIGLPNPAADLGAVYPNLSGSTGKVSSDILSELRGELSPETQNNIANTAASFGVSSGMPLSGLARNKQLETLGLTTEQLQHQGIGDFLSATPVVSKTQTVTPELQSEIASRNALFGAAPNPGSAATTQESLFQQQLNAMRQPQGGRPGGVSSFSAPIPGQGNPPNITAAGPPGVVGPVGPINSGGFSTPAGNPMALTPQGNLYGNTSPTDYSNPDSDPWSGFDTGSVTPWGSDAGSAQTTPSGGGQSMGDHWVNDPTEGPVNDLASVYSSTAAPAAQGGDWSEGY